MSTGLQPIAEPAETPTPAGSLWQAFARSVRDNVLAELALQVIRIGGIVVLARELTPDDFGVFRVLAIVMVFTLIPVENGIPDALIQRRKLLPEHQATGWFLSVGFAIVMSSAAYLLAPFIASLMAMPALTASIRLLCIPFVIEGTAMASNARLRRELRFGALASAEVFAEMTFLAAALGLLAKGYPRWSLPGGLAARVVGYSLALWAMDRRFVFAMPRLWAARDIGRFTTSVWGARVFHSSSSNADFLLVGKFLGPAALGFYSMAWDLLRFAPDRLFKVAGRVTFPAFARVQDDNEEMSHAFIEFTGFVAKVVLPIMLLAAIVAPELIRLVYGAKWLPTVVPLRLLAIGFMLVGLRIAIGSIYFAKDHPSFDIYVHGTRLVLIVITVLPLATMFGLGAVSADMAVVEGSVSLFGLYMAGTLIDTSLARLLTAALPGLRLAIICSLLAGAGKGVALFFGFNNIEILAAEVVPPALAFLWLEAPLFTDMIAKAFAPARSQAA
jgi:O-antigen/teichoic acid export membrane protein